MQTAINTALIAAIVAKCEVSADKAAEILRNAKATAKTMGLPVADTLKLLGMV